MVCLQLEARLISIVFRNAVIRQYLGKLKILGWKFALFITLPVLCSEICRGESAINFYTGIEYSRYAF